MSFGGVFLILAAVRVAGRLNGAGSFSDRQLAFLKSNANSWVRIGGHRGRHRWRISCGEFPLALAIYDVGLALMVGTRPAIWKTSSLGWIAVR